MKDKGERMKDEHGRPYRETEIPIPLNLSVEVWFGYREGQDISVAVLSDGVNDLVRIDFSFDDLYHAMCAPSEETTEERRLLDAAADVRRKKSMLNRMAKFVTDKGYKFTD